MGKLIQGIAGKCSLAIINLESSIWSSMVGMENGRQNSDPRMGEARGVATMYAGTDRPSNFATK